jgi:regulator of replication initiation timing
LRQSLYDLKNQERDYRGVNDDIFSMQNRYKLLSEEKVRSEMEGRSRLDRGTDEIGETRKQIEDLKYMLSEKSRQNMELQDELSRSKRVLDEKFFEAGKNRDESNAKGDQVVDLRSQVAELERDIDLVKSQRADMFREITRLRDVQDMKTKESLDQHDRSKALEYDLQKTLIRIEETNKAVEARSFEIRNQNVSLQDNEKEVARLRELNANQNAEIVALRRDVDRVSADCYDYRKNIEATEARNVDLAGKIRSVEIRCKEKEDNLYGCKKDIENQQYTNTNMRNDLNDYLAEKEALERHSRILLGQNDDLTKELERFVNTDEVLR